MPEISEYPENQKKYPKISLDKFCKKFWLISKNPENCHLKSLKWTNENDKFTAIYSKIFHCDHKCWALNVAQIALKCITCAKIGFSFKLPQTCAKTYVWLKMMR